MRSRVCGAGKDTRCGWNQQNIVECKSLANLHVRILSEDDYFACVYFMAFVKLKEPMQSDRLGCPTLYPWESSQRMPV
jgi:hypothetical protein